MRGYPDEVQSVPSIILGHVVWDASEYGCLRGVNQALPRAENDGAYSNSEVCLDDVTIGAGEPTQWIRYLRTYHVVLNSRPFFNPMLYCDRVHQGASLVDLGCKKAMGEYSFGD